MSSRDLNLGSDYDVCMDGPNGQLFHDSRCHHFCRIFWKGMIMYGGESESKVEKDVEVFVNEFTAGGTA